MVEEVRIRAALIRMGVTDILTWARQHSTLSLVDLTELLDAGVAPVDVERFMADQARDSGRYDELVRMEAVRRLNERFPRGIRQTQSLQFEAASGWSAWAWLFEPSRRQLARETWYELVEALKGPDWCPASGDDELVLDVFKGRSFEPSEAARKLAKAVRRMEQLVESRAAANLRSAPRGYGWLYGLYSVDGQVNNGGFLQYYTNCGGTPTSYAVEGFRAIEDETLASIVEESLAAAFHFARELIAKEIVCPTVVGNPRTFDELDEAYYRNNEHKAGGWLEAAMGRLVIERPAEF